MKGFLVLLLFVVFFFFFKPRRSQSRGFEELADEKLTHAVFLCLITLFTTPQLTSKALSV